jgi:hypothetical protein
VRTGRKNCLRTMSNGRICFALQVLIHLGSATRVLVCSDSLNKLIDEAASHGGEETLKKI